MALSFAVEGARYIAQSITWTDEDGTAVDLTGAVLSGRIRNTATGVVTAIDGTLTPDADQATNPGVFTWAYGTNDVGTVGLFEVQFIATFGSLTEKTLLEKWQVYDALEL